MSTFSNVSPAPIPETVKHKMDNLDWENMPTGTCELNYPLALTVARKNHIRILFRCLLVSAIFPLAAGLIGQFVADRFLNWYWGMGTGIIGILLFVYYHRRRFQNDGGKFVPLFSWTSLGFLFGPTFLWLAVVLTGRLNEPVGAFLYYGLIATPMLFILADLTATHTIHRLSAGLLLDYETLTSWREDWRHRFLEDTALSPVLDDQQKAVNPASYQAACLARHNYFLNGFWICGAILAPCLALMVFVQQPRREILGLQIGCGLLLGLTLAAWLRAQGQWSVVVEVGKSLIHWLHYGNQGQLPPWVFRSPCGSLRFRRFFTIVTIGCLSVALGSLAFNPIVYVISTLPTSCVAQDNAHDIQPIGERSAMEMLRSFTSFQWILLAVAVLIGLFVPVIVLFVGMLVIIGPIVHAYAKALS